MADVTRAGQGLSRLCLLLVAVLLSACATSPRNVESSGILPLLAPSTLGESREVTQVLHGEHGERTFTLRCVVTIKRDQLTVVGVTSMGLRAFTLRYDGNQLTQERASQVPDALQAERLLNDLQLVYWPLASLQQAWRAAGVEVSEPYSGTRRLQRNGVLLAEVHYAADPWNGRVWLRHFDNAYSLFIETEPLAPAP